jgi:hypothetical protein
MEKASNALHVVSGVCVMVTLTLMILEMVLF